MPIGRVGAAGTPEEWFHSLPVVTKSLLVLAVGTIFLLGFGLVPIYSLTLNWFGVWHKFELWRLVTSGATLGHPSISALMNLLMLYQYSVRLEKDMFDAGGGGGSADYLWMLIFSQALLCAANVLYFDMPITSSSLILSIVYVWSRKNPNGSASFWGIAVQSQWIPWLIVGTQALMGMSLAPGLLGIVVGHAYYFLVDVLPATNGGKTILRTPSFLIKWLGDGFQGAGVQRYAPPGATAPPAYIQTTRGDRNRESDAPGLRHRWGGEGRVLGRS